MRHQSFLGLGAIALAAALSGCAVYPAGGVYESYPVAGTPVVVEQGPPVYLYGGATVYRGGVYGPPPLFYHRPYPYARPHYYPQPHAGGHWRGGAGWGRGDRDRDGVPNRFDRRPHDPRYR